MIAIEATGYVNPEHSDRYNDLFYVIDRPALAKQTLMTFDSPREVLTSQLADSLALRGITPVISDWRATRTMRAEFCTRWPKFEGLKNVANADPKAIYGYWLKLFKRFGVKLYVSWHRYDTRHIAIRAAAQASGAKTMIYQRSLNPDFKRQFPMSADIACVYGASTIAVEMAAGSKVDHFRICGYLGDYRFRRLSAQATQMREYLKSVGCQFIIAYFDQNSVDTKPPGNKLQQAHYRFILTKLLEDPTLGVVFKPKAPATLRARLGEQVSQLFSDAIASTRCVVYDDSSEIMSNTPPAAAALVADLVIHGHAAAGTAGVEARLAGIPTVFLNEEQWACGVIASTGAVYDSWDHLWPSVKNTRENGTTLGRWTNEALSLIDPFRDGRARDRMSDYIEELL